MSNVAVHAGDAETITKKVLDVLNENGISFSKVVGLGSDGAVMTGKRNGVGMKFKNLDSFLVYFQCCAQLVALAANDVAKYFRMRVRVQSECQQHFPIF